MSGIHNYLVKATPASLLPGLQRTASANGTGVDVTQYDGFGIAVVDVAAVSGTTPTCDVKLQDCATSGGTYADIPGAAIAQITTVSAISAIPVDLAACKQFVRAVVTIAGTSPVYNVSVTLVGQKKY